MKNLISLYINEISKIVKGISKKNYYLLHEPSLGKDDIFQLKKCINSSYVSTVSKYVNTFEKIFVRPIWKLMHKIKYLKKYPRIKIRNSLIAEKGLISLPSSADLVK